MRTILLVILILLLLGALPLWPYNAGWGYYPGGGLGLILIILIVLIVVAKPGGARTMVPCGRTITAGTSP